MVPSGFRSDDPSATFLERIYLRPVPACCGISVLCWQTLSLGRLGFLQTTLRESGDHVSPPLAQMVRVTPAKREDLLGAVTPSDIRNGVFVRFFSSWKF
ncbi:hypothetical protein NPIL_564341 [Nephila pilipes]|uniref:Uncharacterized protein n=1 Tax=Nephila pilipes TaxID=299642 RepID=A0A8X6PMG3_NEPPI|nr:hypothetical protein NPIL_564341 [Nephila pilipes]